MIIKANNPLNDVAEKTYLSDPVAAGATTINVKATQGYTNADYIMIGAEGSEKTEIKAINATVSSKTQLTVTACDYTHNEGDPVTFMKYNQMKFYMATSLTGTYSLQTTVGIDVENYGKITTWDDTDGVAGNYYKVSYFNDVTSLESALSDPIPGSGLSANTVRAVTDDILREAKDPNENTTTRDEILRWFNDCNEDVKSRRRKWSFLATRAVASRVASRETYSLTTDFGVTDLDAIDHLTYNYIDATTNTDIIYRLRFVPLHEFDLLTEDSNASTDNQSQKFTYDEYVDYIRVSPVPETAQTASYYLYYFKKFTEINSDGDTLDIPDTRIYKFYCLDRFFAKKGDTKQAQYYSMKFEQAVSNLARKENRVVGQPKQFIFNKDFERRYFKF